MTEPEVKNQIRKFADLSMCESKLDKLTHQGYYCNLSCQDVVSVQLNIENNEVYEVATKVSGCVVCQASTYLMSQMIQWESVENSKKILPLLKSAFLDSSNFWPHDLEELRILQNLKSNPRRLNCILVPWLALENALN